MTVGGWPISYWWKRLIEARAAILIGSAIVAVLALAIWVKVVRNDPFGSVHSSDPGVICNKYGEGHLVCSAAPPGVKRYREDLRKQR